MAGRREWAQATAYASLQSLRRDRVERENKSLGVRKGVRLGVIKAAGKGSVQPSAGGIKGTQSGHKGH